MRELAGQGLIKGWRDEPYPVAERFGAMPYDIEGVFWSHRDDLCTFDILLSEFGQVPQLSQISRQFQDAGGAVVSITRHTANPLRAHADAALVVSAHDPAPHIAQLLYRCSLQSLLDFVFVLLCQTNPDRERQLAVNLERVQHLLDA